MLASFFTELNFFRSAFSRQRQYLWFCVICLGFVVSQDKPGGVSPMIRGFHLGGHAYRSILNFFSQAEVFISSLEQRFFEWIQVRFAHSMPTINGKTAIVIDNKKIAKEGKRMPGNKWMHQNSDSNAKPEYFTGHMFEALGLLIKVGSKCFLAPFCCRLISGFKHNNRDTSTLKTRASDVLTSFDLSNSIVVADAWYAAETVAQPVVDASSTLVSRVSRNAVGYEEPINEERIGPGRPKKYGDKIKLIDLFDDEDLVSCEVTGVDGREQSARYWTKDLMWKPLGKIVRFVGVEFESQKIILLSRTIAIEPTDIITAYKYRTAIEVAFWYSNQTFHIWSYRFWSKKNSCMSTSFKTKNLHFMAKEERSFFWQKIASYEAFVCIGFLVQNLMLYFSLLAFQQSQSFDKILWFRSVSVAGPTQIGIRDVIISCYANFLRAPSDQCGEMKFISKIFIKAARANQTYSPQEFAFNG